MWPRIEIRAWARYRVYEVRCADCGLLARVTFATWVCRQCAERTSPPAVCPARDCNPVPHPLGPPSLINLESLPAYPTHMNRAILPVAIGNLSQIAARGLDVRTLVCYATRTRHTPAASQFGCVWLQSKLGLGN
jgi:hypothetical protein